MGTGLEPTATTGSMMSDIPKELQHLRNLIDSAKDDIAIEVLRDVIRSAADCADKAGVIRLAETILQCGIEIDRKERN